MPQREQLALIGESDTQMHFTSETWGLTKFYPTKDDSWAHNCKLCILNRSEECFQAPCTPRGTHRRPQRVLFHPQHARRH